MLGMSISLTVIRHSSNTSLLLSSWIFLSLIVIVNSCPPFYWASNRNQGICILYWFNLLKNSLVIFITRPSPLLICSWESLFAVTVYCIGMLGYISDFPRGMLLGSSYWYLPSLENLPHKPFLSLFEITNKIKNTVQTCVEKQEINFFFIKKGYC